VFGFIDPDGALVPFGFGALVPVVAVVGGAVEPGVEPDVLGATVVGAVLTVSVLVQLARPRVDTAAAARTRMVRFVDKAAYLLVVGSARTTSSRRT
jgi:hypothetical protein